MRGLRLRDRGHRAPTLRNRRRGRLRLTPLGPPFQAAPPSPALCPRCEALEDRPDSAFCRRCGAQLSVLAEAPPPSVSDDPRSDLILTPDTIVDPPKLASSAPPPAAVEAPKVEAPPPIEAPKVEAPPPIEAPKVEAPPKPSEPAPPIPLAPLPHGYVPVSRVLELTKDPPWYRWSLGHALRLGAAAALVGGTLMGLELARKVYGKMLAKALATTPNGWLIDFIEYAIACVASAGIGFVVYRLTSRTWARTP